MGNQHEALIADLREKARQIRINVLRIAGMSDCHTGGSLSIADLLAGLYSHAMRVDPKRPDWDGRDYFVLSKGHCVPALDAALALIETEMQKPLMDRDFAKAEAALKDVASRARLTSILAEVETAQAEIKFQQQLQEGMRKKEADRKALEAELEVLRQKEEALIAKTRQAPVIADNKPLYTGTLKKMLARMTYTYRLEDADGNYLCMIEGDDPELAQFVGKKVNLWGTAKYRVDLKINVVTVTSIEEAK